jgi:hypothetical protein
MKIAEFVECLKIIHCMSYKEFKECFDLDEERSNHDYWISKFGVLREDTFKFICGLDSENQKIFFEFAEKKMRKEEEKINVVTNIHQKSSDMINRFIERTKKDEDK